MTMKICSFDEVKKEWISNMQRGMLIPIIGAGFTQNCTSYKGRVPSGRQYRQHMIASIMDRISLTEEEQDKLEKDTFSNISSIYHKTVPPIAQETYLRENFTRVCIEENKRAFLSLPWDYIYTLNIDDGIESGSDYRRVVYGNRPVNERIFDDEKCVVKLHGDVAEMLTYLDSRCEIFTQEQYVASLRKNEVLLSKLKHDSIFQNLLFIGCSLDDEIDLLFSLVSAEGEGQQTAKYICVTQRPSVLDELKYQIRHYPLRRV